MIQSTTNYINGFVYNDGNLSYFSMPEGRVVKSGGTMQPEYVIADHQGNARFSFKDNGSGGIQILQENSFYAFGKTMPNSTVSLPSLPNINLYNGGSEWQNTFNDLPDYYQTYFRNYDPAIGRFIGVDPKAEATDEMTTYNYTGNNPIMYNDPLGDQRYIPLERFSGDGLANFGNMDYAGQRWNSLMDKAGAFMDNVNPDGSVTIYQDGVGGPIVGSTSIRDNILRGGGFNITSGKFGSDIPLGVTLPEVRVTATRNSAEAWAKAWSAIQMEYNIYNSAKTLDESLLKKLWYSKLARMAVPDMVGINLSSSITIGVGYGLNTQISFMTRGADAGTLHLTGGYSVRSGTDTGLSLTGVSGWYYGDARKATFSGLLGKGFDVSAAYGGAAGSFWGSLGEENNISWFGSTAGLGWGPDFGIPIGSKSKLGLSVGVGYTVPVKDWSLLQKEFNRTFGQ